MFFEPLGLDFRDAGQSNSLSEGVCLNSRHPGPQRVLGRYRAAVRGTDSVDPRDPAMKSFLCVLHVFTAKVARTSLRCNVY